MKTFRILLKSHPDPKGVEIVGTRIEFKSSHGFLKISGGQGEAFFALTDVAAVIDEAALLGAGGGEIDIPPGSTGSDTTLTVPPGVTGSDTTVSVPPASIGSKATSSKRKTISAKPK
jgi:hypothetical protein